MAQEKVSKAQAELPLLTRKSLAQWRSEVEGFFAEASGELARLIEAIEALPEESGDTTEELLGEPATVAPSQARQPEIVTRGSPPRQRSQPDDESAPADDDQRLAELARRIEERLQRSQSKKPDQK